jgi:hypothetical protein
MMPSPATELVALGWCARPSDTGPARSMEGTACHDPGPPRSPLSIVRVARDPIRGGWATSHKGTFAGAKGISHQECGAIWVAAKIPA